MEQNFEMELQEINTYLENKYGEKFVIVELLSDDGSLEVPNKAYAYPEGREEEWFAVRMEINDDGERILSDGYIFILVENAIFPEYEAWLEKSKLDAKITIQLEKEREVTRWQDYELGFTFEEFVEKEWPFGININIYSNEKRLEEKNDFFKRLSYELKSIPFKELNTKCQIVFISANKFGVFNNRKHKGFDLYSFKISEEIKAHTQIFISKCIEEKEMFEILKSNCEEDMGVTHTPIFGSRGEIDDR